MGGTFRWLKQQDSRPAKSKTLEYTLKGPMFSAKAIFERRVSAHVNSQVWQGSLFGEVSLPFGKKHSFAIKYEGANTSGPVFFSRHIETRDQEESLCEWIFSTRGGLECRAPGNDSFVEPELFSNVEAPVVSAADLPFLIEDNWNHDDCHAGSYVVAGGRLFALRLSAASSTLIAGEIVSAQLSDLSGGFAAHSWEKAKKFELIWNEADREILAIRAQAPLVGMIEARLSRASKV